MCSCSVPAPPARRPPCTCANATSPSSSSIARRPGGSASVRRAPTAHPTAARAARGVARVSPPGTPTLLGARRPGARQSLRAQTRSRGRSARAGIDRARFDALRPATRRAGTAPRCASRHATLGARIAGRWTAAVVGRSGHAQTIRPLPGRCHGTLGGDRSPARDASATTASSARTRSSSHASRSSAAASSSPASTVGGTRRRCPKAARSPACLPIGVLLPRARVRPARAVALRAACDPAPVHFPRTPAPDCGHRRRSHTTLPRPGGRPGRSPSVTQRRRLTHSRRQA